MISVQPRSSVSLWLNDASNHETQRTQRFRGARSPNPFERFAFRLVGRMNRGAWKRFWTWCQSTLGAGWIHLSTYNIMNVYGLEHVEAASRERPLLLVANHRSFFDMYAVSTVLFRETQLAQATLLSRCEGGSSTSRRLGCS